MSNRLKNSSLTNMSIFRNDIIKLETNISSEYTLYFSFGVNLAIHQSLTERKVKNDHTLFHLEYILVYPFTSK